MEASLAPYNAFSTIPECLFNCGLKIEDIRNLRAEKESIRLQQLIEYDVHAGVQVKREAIQTILCFPRGGVRISKRQRR